MNFYLFKGRSWKTSRLFSSSLLLFVGYNPSLFLFYFITYVFFSPVLIDTYAHKIISTDMKLNYRLI